MRSQALYLKYSQIPVLPISNQMFVSDLENYEALPKPILNWCDSGFHPKVLVLYGHNGTGKTELAKSISVFKIGKRGCGGGGNSSHYKYF